MYSELDFESFESKTIMINYSATSDHAELVKSLINNKFKFNQHEIKDKDRENFLKIFEENSTKYNNIIVIGSNEEKNNTICIFKIFFDEDGAKINEKMFDYELDDFCKLLSTLK